MEPFHRPARLFHVRPPAGQTPSQLFGTDQILNGGRSIRRAVRVQMIQQQIQATRIQQCMVPGKEQMAGPIRVAHHVKRQTRPPSGMQLACRHHWRQRPRRVHAAILIVVLIKDGSGFCRCAPERGKQRKRTNDARSRHPVQNWRCGDALTQPFQIQAGSQPDDCTTDIARKPGAPHPGVLAVHEIIPCSQSNLTRQVRHRHGRSGAQVEEWLLRARSAMQLASVAMEVKLLPVRCESGTRTPMTRSQ